MIETLKVDAMYLADYGNFEDLSADQLRFIEESRNAGRLRSALRYRSPLQCENQHARRPVKIAARPCPPQGTHSIQPAD